MRKIVSFSGGRTSAYLCKLMIDTYGRDNVEFVYMDTGAEHPKTYDFIRNVNKYMNLNLICLRLKINPELGKGNSYSVVDINDIKPDLKPFKDMMSKYGVPYIGGMFCTDRMKLTPFKKYCDDNYGKKNYETWLGIREDEPKRLGKKAGLKYLAEISDFDKQDVLNWWAKMPFDLDLNEWSGNCEFCLKKSNLKLAASAKDEPESYHRFLSALNHSSVRVDNNTGVMSHMYRGKTSLDGVIAKFDGSTGDEIKARIRGGKQLDTNSCSESCEVFSGDDIE